MLDFIQNVRFNAIVQFDKKDIDFLFEYLVNFAKNWLETSKPCSLWAAASEASWRVGGCPKKAHPQMFVPLYEFKAQISFSMPSMPPKLNVAYERPT